MADLAQHPTVKPVHLIADALRDVSGRGEIVLDGFGGSGSTLSRRGQDRPAGPPLRDRPRLLRPHPRPLGDLCHGRGHAAGGRGASGHRRPGGGAMSRARRGFRPTPAAPPDRRLRPPARGASLHARPVR